MIPKPQTWEWGYSIITGISISIITKLEYTQFINWKKILIYLNIELYKENQMLLL